MIVPAAAERALRSALAGAATRSERGALLRAYSAQQGVSLSTARRHAAKPNSGALDAEPEPIVRTCAWGACGKTFIAPRRGRPKKYCSASCRAMAHQHPRLYKSAEDR